MTAAPGLIIDKSEQDKLAQTAEEAPGGTIEMPNAIFMPGLEEEIEQYELMIPTSPDIYKIPDNYGMSSMFALVTMNYFGQAFYVLRPLQPTVHNAP